MKVNTVKSLSAAVCAAALLLLVGCSSPEEKAKAYYESGMEYLNKQDFAKAAIEFRNALKLNENNADAWFGMAMVEQQSHAWGRAYADLNRVLEIDHKHLKALSGLATLLAVSGDNNGALKYADSAAEIDPKNPDIIAQRAAILSRLGRSQDAVAEAKKALAIKENHVGAVSVLASEAINANDIPSALKLIDTALAASPKDLGLHLIKLTALKKSGDLVKQEQAIRGIIAAFPERPEFRRELIAFLVAQNRTSDAEQELRNNLAASPDDSKAALELASFIDKSKGHAAAREELAKLATTQKNPIPLQMAIADIDFATGRQDDSEKLLREIVAAKGTSDEGIEALLKLNEQLIARNKIADAETGIAEVLKHDGQNVSGLKQRASVAILQGSYEPAIADLRTVLSNTKNDVKAMLLLGNAYERNGQMELAGNSYLEAAQNAANDPAVALNYVRFLIRRGKSDQEQQLLQSVVDRFPDNRNAALMLAQIYQRGGDWQKAADIAKRLSDQNSGDTTSKLVEGQSLLAMQRYDDAIKLLSEDTQYKNTNRYAMKALVQAYVVAKRRADADAYLLSVLKENPKNTDAMILQSSLLQSDGKLKDAEQVLQQAIQTNPSAMDAYVALAWQYEKQGNIDQMIATLNSGISSATEKDQLRLMLAMAYEKSGRFEDAIATYEAIKGSSIDSLLVANNLASLLADHRTDEASLNRAVELAKVLQDSPVPEFQETLGWVLVASGKQKGSLRQLENAVAALDKYPTAHFHLGYAYAVAGKLDLAAKQFETALSLNPTEDIKARIAAAKATFKINN